MTFWCDVCGTKHIVPPLQGTKKRCYQCSMYQLRKGINRRWQKKHNEKHDIPELTSETLFEKDDRHLDEWFLGMQERFKPPVVDRIFGG